MKWRPSIIIWDLELRDIEHETVQHLYFLTKRGVERFVKNHGEEIKDLLWIYGGGQLWLW